jgi:hypothetical protein
MLYIPFIIILFLGGYLLFNERLQIQAIKRNGVKTVGTIIDNGGSNGNSSFYRLGGNVNSPTIQFTTQDGKQVTGKPAIGFVSQFEIPVPSEINIIYSSKNPELFCVDID